MKVWCCYTGPYRRDLSAEAGLHLPTSDLRTFVILIPVGFVIGRDTVLPVSLSCLLGVLHLFVHPGIMTVSDECWSS